MIRFARYLRALRPAHLGRALCSWGLCTMLLTGAALAASVTYTVKSGDNPWTISRKFGVPVETLLAANNLKADSVLQIGQQLTIPVAGTESPTASAPTQETVEYQVRKGDTLSQIAEAHEISLLELLEANGLTERSMIKVGLVLRIPVETAAAIEQLDPNPDPVSHTLVKGESLWTVAKKYGIQVEDLARHNRISLSQVLMPGQALLIPGEGEGKVRFAAADIDAEAPIGGILSLESSAAADEGFLPAGDVVHVVESGDTVSHLAVKYRTTRQAIFAANRIGTRDVLAAGQKIVIPSNTLDAQRDRIAAAQDNTRSKNDLPSRNSTLGQRVAKFAVSHLGTRYVWAGESLTRGVDCSGFVLAVYKNFGHNLPHNSKAQAKVGQAVKRSELQPGDVIAFHTTRPGISHVGIYIGNNQFVHASTRGRKVQIDSLSDPYYDKGYVTARRIL